MNKIYNLKQDVFYDQSDSNSNDDLSELKSMNQKTKRTNEALNLFILIIGVGGFFVVYSMLDDGLYNRPDLSYSFSGRDNSTISDSRIAKQGFSVNDANLDDDFLINGYLEAEETISFEFNNFQPNNGVEYLINFGNGETKRIKDKITTYQYYASGKYEVSIKATFGDETKEVLRKTLQIDNAIIVQSDAFNES